MFSSAGANALALHTDNGKKSSDDRPSCLENPRPAGAESTLTENVASPFQAEPRHVKYGDTTPTSSNASATPPETSSFVVSAKTCQAPKHHLFRISYWFYSVNKVW